jgi:hypothetical protein
MRFYNTETNEYPLYIGDLEATGWDSSKPLPEGYVEVSDSQSPEVQENQKVIELTPELIDGVYFQNFSVIEMTVAEIQENNAPETAKAKLLELGFNDAEVRAIGSGRVR